MHNIYPYHAKFNKIIPSEFIEQYSEEGNTVLDPFCGCGTTLLEALKLKRKAIGVDLSPIGILCSYVKTSYFEKDKIEKYAKQIIEAEDENVLIPNFPDKSYWFSNDVLNSLGKLNYRIKKIKEKKYYSLFLLILLSILNNCSRKRKTWNLGYLADNVLPNTDVHIDVFKLYKSKIKQLYKRTDFLNKQKYDVRCIKADINDVNLKKVDIVVTSPPYPFAVDFIRYHRLALYWMEEKVEELSNEEIGARNKRNKKNAENEFFNDIEKAYLHIMKMVKIGGYWCMTIGDTTRNKKRINFVEWTIDLFRREGWKLISNSYRTLQQQSMAQKRIKQEAMLVFQKKK